MLKEDFASAMDGCEYGSEGSPELFKQMRESRMICLFGYSDDVVEMRGFYDDEFGTDDLLFADGKHLKNACEDEECPYFAEIAKNAAKIEVFDGGSKFGMFEFRTTIPHALFHVMEDGDLYGTGIVFSLDELA